MCLKRLVLLCSLLLGLFCSSLAFSQDDEALIYRLASEVKVSLDKAKMQTESEKLSQIFSLFAKKAKLSEDQIANLQKDLLTLKTNLENSNKDLKTSNESLIQQLASLSATLNESKEKLKKQEALLNQQEKTQNDLQTSLDQAKANKLDALLLGGGIGLGAGLIITLIVAVLK